ncbi:MAG: DNA polymerase III subunit delta' [Deltaproteobacteria bacterium]|nr:DNA polymerase III subunit delta' [Deltaproteobacteria bacterium]
MSFKNIIGHEKQINLLQKIAHTKQLASAYAFSGISGIGKKKVAFEFIKMLNCDDNGCEVCTSCHKINHGNHPDIITLAPSEKNKNIKIEEVRKLHHTLAYAPYEAKYRFIIIDEADCLTEASSNALLKSLEEVPHHTSFILITTSPQKLLPTIISRCQKIIFSPLKTNEIIEILSHLTIPPDTYIPLLASMAEGSVERALLLSESLISKEKRITLIKNLKEKHPLDWASELTQEDIHFLKTWFRDVLILKSIPDLSETLINQDLKDLIHKESEILTKQDIIHKMDVVLEAENRLEWNVNKQLNNEWLGLQLKKQDVSHCERM